MLMEVARADQTSGDAISFSTSTQPSAVTVRHVLEYVTDHSAKAAAAGLSQWAWHGTHFALTHGGTRLAQMDDDVGLADMYGPDNVQQTVAVNIARVQKTWQGRRERTDPDLPLSTDSSSLLSRVSARAESLGQDVYVMSAAQDEECERELEQEKEKEEEREKQVAASKPRAELDWDVSAVVSVDGPVHLLGRCPLVNLAVHIPKVLPAFKGVQWPQAGIYATRNFTDTLLADQLPSAAPEYLRTLDLMLVWPSGQVLLLSEREADMALKLYWGLPLSSPMREEIPCLVNMAYACAAADGPAAGAPDRAMLMSEPPRNGQVLSQATLAALQLFNGRTVFAGLRFNAEGSDFVQGSVLDSLRGLLPSIRAVEAARTIPPARGTAHLMDRSHLELLCEQAAARLHAQAH